MCLVGRAGFRFGVRAVRVPGLAPCLKMVNVAQRRP
jgi:hypothetical protein